MKIDVFAHVLLPQFYQKCWPLIQPCLKNALSTKSCFNGYGKRQALQDPAVKQIISFVNVNPEDYLEAEPALALVQEANQELLETVQAYPNQFLAGVAMLALNNIEGSLEILEDFVAKILKLLESSYFQDILACPLQTRHLDQSLPNVRS